MIERLQGGRGPNWTFGALAATRSLLIQQIKAALPRGADIADKKLTFWVLVRGEVSRRDWLLDMEGVTVLEAGVYE